MRRFDYEDNEENREDVDNFFGDGEDHQEAVPDISPEEYKALLEDEQEMQLIQFDLVIRDLNDRFLFRTVRMLEKSFWWRFYSTKTRLKMIAKAYKELKAINV